MIEAVVWEREAPPSAWMAKNPPRKAGEARHVCGL